MERAGAARQYLDGAQNSLAIRGTRSKRKDIMNNGAGGTRRVRQAAGAAALAGIAVAPAACGGSGGGPTAAAGLTAYQKALNYAQCMRSHGVPTFPDPDSRGVILTTPKDHLAQGSPVFVAANKACGHFDPSTPLSPAQQRQAAAQALKFTECMRTHGILDFPDPIVNSGGVAFHPPAGFKPNSPQLQSAQQACRKLLPGGGP
jgi:hypothetical protein